jgi:signal transduction histidine kinase
VRVQIQESALKLAGLYLLVMMIISGLFSLSIYHLSVQELNRGIRRPAFQGYLKDISLPVGTISPDQLLARELNERYEYARSLIIGRLVFINMSILVFGGGLSYFLAIRTLKPIDDAREAQNRFTADASHELRTPITAMKSETEVALMNPKLTLAEAKNQLQSNIEELDKLARLSDGLLRLASAENAGLPVKSVDVKKLISEAAGLVEHKAASKHIKIDLKVADRLMACGDQASLVEALTILIDNAIKYSPEKSEVVVSAIKTPKRVVISVIDKGIGIKPNEQARIFERFYRSDVARSRTDAGGYGLGLSIAKNIVEQNQGTISVSSKPNKGSVFKIALTSPRT